MKKRLRISIVSLYAISAFLVPMVAYAADSRYGDVPWYARPFVWIIDLFLDLLGGIKDPMDHVFNNGCITSAYMTNSCPDYSVWGMWTQDQFDVAIYRGFWLLFIVAVPLITSAIVKSGIMLSLKHLSPSMKFEMGDALVKAFLAFVLLTQFFTVVGAVFKANNVFVDLFERDLKGGIVVYDDDGRAVPRASAIITTERIAMDDLAQTTSGTNGLGDAIIALVSRGVSIWWEFFYLQRKIMISILMILAPIWISCLFFPTLTGITTTAMKELWSQIIAQTIHAALFWLFFLLFDDTMTWLHILVAMCIFIPISESVRFIFGATSQTGSKLAMAGTMVGAAGLMNLVGAMGSVAKGGTRAIQAARGINPKAGGASTGGASAQSLAQPGGFDNSSGRKQSTAASHNTAIPMNTKRTRALRAVSELGSGIGSAALRMGGMAVGAGVGGGIGAYLGGNAGAQAGDQVGYRAGAATFAVGSAGAAVAKKAKNFPKEYRKARAAVANHRVDEPTKAIFAAGIAMGGGADKYNYKSGNMSPQQMGEMQAASLEKSAGRWGVAGEVAFGRGGYERGDGHARNRLTGRQLTSQTLSDYKAAGHKKVYTVETNGSSVLAVKDTKTGNFKPISNYGRGNSSLATGETVVAEYSLKGSGDHVQMSPVMETIKLENRGGQGPSVKEVHRKQIVTGTGTRSYDKPTADPYAFMKSSKKQTEVDLRRGIPPIKTK